MITKDRSRIFGDVRQTSRTGRAGRDRWLVSYADFITLLFAFFVVMYSVSSINDGKYKVFSATLDAIFQQPLKKIEAIRFDSLASFFASFDDTDEFSPIKESINEGEYKKTHMQDTFLDSLIMELNNKFSDLIKDQYIQLHEEQDWLEIEIKSSILFNTGGSFLREEAEDIIVKLAAVLQRFVSPITIEGFTDNVPISNNLYPSNWELSADRATAVVRALVGAGIESTRLAVVGYGNNFPVGDNRTEEGRSKNRRVVFLVEKNNKRRAYLTLTNNKYQNTVPAVDKEGLDDENVADRQDLGKTGEIKTAQDLELGMF